MVVIFGSSHGAWCSVETFGADPNRPSHSLPGERHEGLLISAAVYDTSVPRRVHGDCVAQRR